MKKYFVFVAAVAFSLGFASCEEDNDVITEDKVPVLADSEPSAVVAAGGFYVANEDWFGHDNGTVNYFKADGSIVYRAYRAANEGETFGATTQFATIYGDNAYFVSKQKNRLVVADAKTLKKKTVFVDLGGDGRSFVGIDDKLGYIGYNGGVRKFDIANLQLGDPIEGVNGQIGTMCYAEGRVFIVSSKAIFIVNVAESKVEKKLDGSFNTVTRSKDGNVWIAAAANFIKVNPVTLTEEVVAYPNGMAVGSSWGAWNAGSLCASTQQNVLYWTNKTTVVKYDVTTNAANTSFYTLGKDAGNVDLDFYGAAMRVDPISDHLILQVKRSGWGNSGSFNWIHMVKADGSIEKEIVVKGDNGSVNGVADDSEGNYYWFPAMPFFEDANAPEILVNQIRLTPGEIQTIDLNKKIVDADNTSASILRSVEFAENDLVTYQWKDGLLTVTAKEKIGGTQCKVTAVSNGKKVVKQVRVDVVAATSIQ